MKKYLFLLLIFTLNFSSCTKDFLKEHLVSDVSYDHYDTEEGVESLINSCYAHLRDWAGTETSLRMTQFGTDIYTYTDVAAGSEWHLYNANLNPADGDIASIWNSFYKGINSCNIAIEKIPTVKGEAFLKDENGKNVRLGEVKFLRAYYYFILVQTFGDIPLLTNGNISVETDIKRSSVTDVYQLIINDLIFAAAHLPESQDDYGRATKAAAQHLLAKVYLTRGSAISDQRGQKPTDMDSAAYYADIVIAEKGSLLPDYNDAWRQDNERNKEVLFSVQYTPDLLMNGNGNQTNLFYIPQYDLLPGMDRDLANGRPLVRLRPSNYLYNLYNRKIDSRFYKAYKTVFFANASNPSEYPKWTQQDAPSPELVGKAKFALGDTAIFFSFDENVPDSRVDKRPYNWFPRNKWTEREFPFYQYEMDPNRSSVNDSRGGLDAKLMMLSETYLIAAEAYGRMGNYAKATDLINVVRDRAAYKEGEAKTPNFYQTDGGNVSDLYASTKKQMEISENDINSPDKLINFILEEKARELCGIPERWFDLVRTETLYNRVKMYNPAAAQNIQPYHKLRPIPQSHIDKISNPGPISEEQNLGYY